MAINSNLGGALLHFTFSDGDEVISSFRINPGDLKLVQRFQAASAFFDNLEKNVPENATFEDIVQLNDNVERKICEVLGYDARESLFGRISATTILPDGNLFVSLVLDKIAEHAVPEIQKRNKAMVGAMEKHTAKYAK